MNNPRARGFINPTQDIQICVGLYILCRITKPPFSYGVLLLGGLQTARHKAPKRTNIQNLEVPCHTQQDTTNTSRQQSQPTTQTLENVCI